MPATWVIVSKEIMNGEVLPQTPFNEKYVAIKKMQKLFDKGHSEWEVALIWNGSLGGSEKPIEKSGVNNGVKYNTVEYATTVLGYYKALK